MALYHTSDLDHFIKGEISFEEIKGFIHEVIPIQKEISLSLQDVLFYSEKEHDLYEKLNVPHINWTGIIC